MRRYGLSGKSIVPLISGTACAIPAIMSARNIENWKERLITILVTPFTTCSARLPVYAIIISLIIPEEKVLGFLSLQGLALMFLYLIGFFMAIFSSWLLDKFLKLSCKTYFVVEMPSYKIPMFKNVGINVLEKLSLIYRNILDQLTKHLNKVQQINLHNLRLGFLVLKFPIFF